MADHLAELKKACSSHEAPAPEEKIKDGESRWFMGQPSPASPGTVALAQPGGFNLTFREKDVVEVKRHEHLFFVRTSPDANLLVSVEQVVNATSIGCGCKSEESKTESSARSSRGIIWTGWGDDVYIFNRDGCAFYFDCKWVDIPLLGRMYLCIPTGLICN